MGFERWMRWGGWIVLLFGVWGEDAQGGLREIRAIWVTRWGYTEKPGDAREQQDKVRAIFRAAKEAHANTIFFQVRGQADAFYRSRYEPWSDRLTGTLGEDPGWDPLALAIQEGKRYGLKVHAWMNVFTCWKGPPPPHSTPRHLYHTHPEWLCVDETGQRMEPGGAYAWVSPGIPGVREHILKVIQDVVEQYDVDGIHLDYVRYPGRGYSYDPISLDRFYSPVENPDGLAWGDWQREQVNGLVRAVHTMIGTVRPAARLSASVIGIYYRAGGRWDGYNVVYQDAPTWLREGFVDMLTPMTYWEREGMFPFAELVYTWVRHAYGRHICPGIAVYKYLDRWLEVEGQIRLSRWLGAQGNALFSQASLDEGRYWSALGDGVWGVPANVPTMPWRDRVPPNPPGALRAHLSSDGQVVLSWTPPSPAPDGDAALYYNVYRSTELPLDASDPRQLVYITGEGCLSWVDRPEGGVEEQGGKGAGGQGSSPLPVASHRSEVRPEGGRTYVYAVSALDNGDVESPLSNRVEVHLGGRGMMRGK